MKKVINILLAEDDTLDQLDVKRTLDRRNILHKLTVVTNGKEALKLLLGPERKKDYKPDIFLLDLNMPKMNGLEVLAALRESEEWSDLKVFILTTSDEKLDHDASRQYGISGFITKPLKLESPSSQGAFNLMIDLMNI